MRPKIVGFLNWTYLANATHNTEYEASHSSDPKFKSHRYLPYNKQNSTIQSHNECECVCILYQTTTLKSPQRTREKKPTIKMNKKSVDDDTSRTAHDIQFDNTFRWNTLRRMHAMTQEKLNESIVFSVWITIYIVNDCFACMRFLICI